MGAKKEEQTSDDPRKNDYNALMPTHKVDTQHHTYADYLTWSACYGEELIDGVAYVREPPSPSRAHQEIVGEIHRQAGNAGSRRRHQQRGLTCAAIPVAVSTDARRL